MGGLFGGLLSVLELIGVLFFTLLIGGRRAERLRLLAVVAGGVIIFGVLGALVSVFNPDMLAGPNYRGEPVSLGQAFAAGALLGGFVGGTIAAALFGLASHIEEQEARERREKERLAEEERRKREAEARRAEYEKDLIAQGVDKFEAKSRAQKEIKMPGEGCFIATAVYESSEACEVLTLRTWRDEVLLPSAVGRSFVRVYYSLSPALANAIKHNASMKKTLRSLIGLLVRKIAARNKAAFK